MLASSGLQIQLSDFMTMLKVNNYPGITAGIDSAGVIDKLFIKQALPQINIYNADRKLLRIYSGEASIDSLRQYIE